MVKQTFIQTVLKVPPYCWKCVHYKPVEERVGVCIFFGNVENARQNRGLCGPAGKHYKPNDISKELLK
jgi:hypothetical protein